MSSLLFYNFLLPLRQKKEKLKEPTSSAPKTLLCLMDTKRRLSSLLILVMWVGTVGRAECRLSLLCPVSLNAAQWYWRLSFWTPWALPSSEISVPPATSLCCLRSWKPAPTRSHWHHSASFFYFWLGGRFWRSAPYYAPLQPPSGGCGRLSAVFL